ncbi:RidA family protein [Chromatocurvus halotolerans]|uniref:Enamine deaminase RidA (YjgF/YER057c/UK114 family) n=1 Tax=Chromatocurvus halotolerans TaxID=1132028 RepID=A0A4R2KFD3_9GAMM|nr:RidA family protein [Chromatocurvus halotolerans]TCO69086.1 enamine deaminase RidA (YjgF/YER057c/UK114 family) [Chromatocurvus halotolerans]
MKSRAINSTPWMEHFGLNHAIEVTGGERVLYVSGQASTDAEGVSLHDGDLVAQFAQAWSNLKAVLVQADMGPRNIVRMNIYTTDVAMFMEHAESLIPLWSDDGAKPACTLLEVAGLFDPALMVEIEATAVA